MANKLIDGNQCTILWHVNNLKISHVDPLVVSEIVNLLDKRFGQEAPSTKTQGKIHEYLGMTIDLSNDGKVWFSMMGHIQQILDNAPPDMEGES